MGFQEPFDDSVTYVVVTHSSVFRAERWYLIRVSSHVKVTGYVAFIENKRKAWLQTMTGIYGAVLWMSVLYVSHKDEGTVSHNDDAGW